LGSGRPAYPAVGANLARRHAVAVRDLAMGIRRDAAAAYLRIPQISCERSRPICGIAEIGHDGLRLILGNMEIGWHGSRPTGENE
jgi:hypothetical protein